MAVRNKYLSRKYSVVAFYGFRTDASTAGQCYDAVIEWFESNNSPPQRMGVGAKGFSEDIVSFSRPHARLTQLGFQGVEDIVIHSKEPDEMPESFDGRMTAMIAFEGKYAILAADSVHIPLPRMVDTARTMIDILNPSYGIGYQLEIGKGPTWYALGINYGETDVYSGPEYEKEVLISRWMDTGMPGQVYELGLLRDVYPCNFLTEPQLSRPVGGVPLRDWIRQNPERGRIAPFQHNVWLWSLDELTIGPVREALWNAGVIFNGLPPD